MPWDFDDAWQWSALLMNLDMTYRTYIAKIISLSTTCITNKWSLSPKQVKWVVMTSFIFNNRVWPNTFDVNVKIARRTTIKVSKWLFWQSLQNNLLLSLKSRIRGCKRWQGWLISVGNRAHLTSREKITKIHWYIKFWTDSWHKSQKPKPFEDQKY